MDLKSILKALKLNESTISMVLGALVIVVVGVLVVNYFKDQGGRIPFLSTGNKTEVTQELPKNHTVAKGENLWTIAEKYYGSGYNWVDIAKENKLENPGFITDGQQITIPSVEPKLSTLSESQTSEPISSSIYSVEKGDTLWSIAVRSYGDGYRWIDIAKENNLIHPNLIHHGNVLTFPR